jgi:hypothetical protein
MSDNKVRVLLVKGGKVVKDSLRAVKWYPFGNFAGCVLDVKHGGTRVSARCVPDTNHDAPGNPFVVYDLDQGKQVLAWENAEAYALIYPPAPRVPNPFAPAVLTAALRSDSTRHVIHAGMPSVARVNL